MKTSTNTLFFGLALLVVQSYSHGNYKQMGIYLEKNLDWGDITNTVVAALEQGYTRLYVGFFMSKYGCQAACAAVKEMNPIYRAQLLDTIHSYGAQMYLSVGGPGEYAEGIIRIDNSSAFGIAAGQEAASLGFDGIDLAVHLSGEGTIASPFASNGSFIDYVQNLAIGVSQAGFKSSNIAVSAQAPYFSPMFVNGKLEYSLSYLGLNSNQGQAWAVNDLNLLMFNEDNDYMTYEDIFIKNTYVDPYYGSFGAGSSVLEIANLGINITNIAVIKPVTKEESTVRNGYVAPSTLGNWACQAHNTFDWMGGFVGWLWTDLDTDAVMAFYQATSLSLCW